MGLATERATLIACDVDDMTGEEIGWAAEALRAAPGVLDVLLIPAQGKKGRPMTRIEILACPEHARAVAEAAFARTSTLGLRLGEVSRLTLPRSETAVGGARVKHATRPGGDTAKIESDDLASAGTLAERRRRARAAEGME